MICLYRIHLNPRENIKKALDDSLKVLCEDKERNTVTRLDARLKFMSNIYNILYSLLHFRLGKVLWSRLPEHMYTNKYEIERLAELLFAEDARHRNTFTTEYVILPTLPTELYFCHLYSVKVDRAEGLRPELARSSSSHLELETFDVKVTSVGSGRSEEEGTRLDVRLHVKRRDNGQIELHLLLVKKDEIRDVTFDIVNLHRYAHGLHCPLEHRYTHTHCVQAA